MKCTLYFVERRLHRYTALAGDPHPERDLTCMRRECATSGTLLCEIEGRLAVRARPGGMRVEMR
jgi:hypothetical protein